MDLSKQELKQSILSLIKLQEIDGQLYQMNEETAQPSEALRQLQARVSDSEKAHKLVERAYREIERERRGFELRLITMKQDVQKAELRRKEVRNTKEEFASGKEVEQLQRKLQELEKSHSDKQASVNEKRALMEEKAKEVESLQAELKSLETERQQRVQEIEAQKKALQEARETHTTRVNEQLFQMYERVQKIRKGTGVAIVKQGVCTACYVAIPPHQKTKLIKLEALETCSSCSRILFPEELLPEEASSTTAEDAPELVSQDKPPVSSAG